MIPEIHLSNVVISLLTDVDECELEVDICDEKAMCTNTIGSYKCECESGFLGDGTICNGKLMLFYVLYLLSNYSGSMYLW